MSKFFTSHDTPRTYTEFHQIDNDIHTVILENTINDNPLTNQGIKFGNKTYRLVFFEKSPTNLSYKFEKDISLKFYYQNNYVLIWIINPKIKMNVIRVWSEKQNIVWREAYKELNYINSLL